MHIFRTQKGPISCDCRQLFQKMIKCRFKWIRFLFCHQFSYLQVVPNISIPDGWRRSLISCLNVFRLACVSLLSCRDRWRYSYTTVIKLLVVRELSYGMWNTNGHALSRGRFHWCRRLSDDTWDQWEWSFFFPLLFNHNLASRVFTTQKAWWKLWALRWCVWKLRFTAGVCLSRCFPLSV